MCFLRLWPDGASSAAPLARPCPFCKALFCLPARLLQSRLNAVAGSQSTHNAQTAAKGALVCASEYMTSSSDGTLTDSVDLQGCGFAQ